MKKLLMWLLRKEIETAEKSAYNKGYKASEHKHFQWMEDYHKLKKSQEKRRAGGRRMWAKLSNEQKQELIRKQREGFVKTRNGNSESIEVHI